MRWLDVVRRSVTPWGWALVATVAVGAVVSRALGWTEALVAAVAAGTLIAGAVPWVVGERWARARIGLSAERVPVGSPALALVCWIHYLVFDLFVGAWIVRDAARRGVAHLAVVPCLLLTLMVGPAGLLLYLVLRLAFRRVATLEEDVVA